MTDRRTRSFRGSLLLARSARLARLLLSRRPLALGLAVLTCTSVTCLALPAAYADDATDKARVHFEVGIRRYDKKDYEGALAEFRAAYAEKSSPALLRNVALCLRALGRNAETIDTLEQMLRDGGDTLKPEVRRAAQRTIDELGPSVGSVRVRATLRDPPGASPVRIDVTVDGRLIPADRLGASVRVDPGLHTFAAHAVGHADASLQMRVVAGQHDTLVGLDLVPGTQNGRLRVDQVAPTASISVDGVQLATGGWEGDIAPGPHKIEVSAPGAPSWSRDVVVRTGETTVVEAAGAEGIPPVPPEVHAPKRAPELAPHFFYLALGFTLHEGTRTLAPGPFAERAPTVRGFVGGGAFAKVGHHFGKFVSLEAWSEIGASKPVPYATNGGTHPDYGVAYVELGPAIRVHSAGRVVRVYGGTGLGLDATLVNGSVHDLSSNAYHLKGGGVGGCWTLEAGVSFIVAAHFFIDAGPFFNLSGAGIAKESSTDRRFFEDSPATRGGVRLLAGIDL